MDFDRSSARAWRAVFQAVAVLGAGLIAAYAWTMEFWALFTGASIVIMSLLGLTWRDAWKQQSNSAPSADQDTQDDAEPGEPSAIVQSLLLDAAPIPIVTIYGSSCRALNRASRNLFETDNLILPPPKGLLEPETRSLKYAGRQWRIDRVVAVDTGIVVAALIDVQKEAGAMEARITAELIDVLGHELLNGLAPIVSLAESAQAAIEEDPANDELLSEILGPLARRAEGLQRFTQQYHSLARLPEPTKTMVNLDEFGADLARSFALKWPHITLSSAVEEGLVWPMDRAQLTQAVWNLLKNAAEVLGEGSGGVTLEISASADLLRIAVSDDGPGVPVDTAGQIFRPFFSTKSEGSGIGLSLAQQIAQTHGGALELAHSEPTTFVLSLPR